MPERFASGPQSLKAASPLSCCQTHSLSGQATEALRITATELVKFKVMDEIVPEPAGGAHADPMGCFPAIKDALVRNWDRCPPSFPHASIPCTPPTLHWGPDMPRARTELFQQVWIWHRCLTAVCEGRTMHSGLQLPAAFHVPGFILHVRAHRIRTVDWFASSQRRTVKVACSRLVPVHGGLQELVWAAQRHGAWNTDGRRWL